MISPEAAKELVLSNVDVLPVEEANLLDSIFRVAAEDLRSDSDVAPFANSAMDGYALKHADIANASEDSPVHLRVVGEVPAGSYFEGPIASGECVRIMTGAMMPDDADSVVKYEIVGIVEGDGRKGSVVSFAAPTKERSNVREAGEEAKAGQVIVSQGEVINPAGVGFLASCGISKVPLYARPKVAIIATGSELVDPQEAPGKGKIRNSNSYAIASCVIRAGGIPILYPVVEDTEEALTAAIERACGEANFIVSTGGAANGDFDFIKKVVSKMGTLLMSTVNMRPGKAQTFGIVNGVPVFGLPGNPAAAYVGFELLIRPALRKMQGYTHLDPHVVWARLSRDMRKKDSRRIYLRAALYKKEDGEYEVVPASNQSSGLFGVIQKSNCLAILPEGTDGRSQGDLVKCIVLDIPEDVVL